MNAGHGLKQAVGFNIKDQAAAFRPADPWNDIARREAQKVSLAARRWGRGVNIVVHQANHHRLGRAGLRGLQQPGTRSSATGRAAGDRPRGAADAAAWVSVCDPTWGGSSGENHAALAAERVRN